ncbi:Myb-like DNA-binding domain-containing protein [Spironucleus salmonicida]|uniref:Myb-like DNA-binding domain-containing protein n=1 Tax=Spironucleus salmonicida TaxID=348837 RepID=V6LCS7_9EUKA|nr:Myb-like DNA-binding domain-containing protein [Spironucleus salmonicida]KAH0572427.1 Myb-like DNA-binding domain-containing protein [Spironucleus salmonicida]|eukprot:EST41481.1 Myb-like DNA-binding domain-containing protein [Spironucleus salmonicida]
MTDFFYDPFELSFGLAPDSGLYSAPRSDPPSACSPRSEQAAPCSPQRVPWGAPESELLAVLASNRELTYAQIAEHLNGRFRNGRDGKQCQQRWSRTQNPAIVKGRWAAAEDLRLVELAERLCNVPKRIHAAMPQRSVAQIKLRLGKLGRPCCE